MLNRLLSPKLQFVTITLLCLCTVVTGQDGSSPGPEPRNMRPRDERPNFLAQLGLSQDQIQQFQKLSAEHRPVMQAAQQRLREANRELDMAIYADTVSDEVVRARLRAFQEAQVEVNRLRFTNEFAIRKILTPEQLVQFRDMRRRFGELRERQDRQGRPSNGQQRRDAFQPQRQPDGNQLNRPAIKQTRPSN